MYFSLSLFLAILFVAGGVLIWEARTGRFTSGSPERDTWRGILFFFATVVGGVLLIRSAGGTLFLALAFVPVTLLSLMRLVVLARQRWAASFSTLALAAALLVGIVGGLSVLPDPVAQGMLLEQILYPDGGPAPDSIDPGAARPVLA